MDIPDTSSWSDASPHASLPHYILHKGETIIASDQYEKLLFWHQTASFHSDSELLLNTLLQSWC